MLLDELSSGNPAGRRRRLLLWYFEDQLKDLYKEFIEAVRVISTDSVEANKEKAIKAMGTLLESHPEQEAVCTPTMFNICIFALDKVFMKLFIPRLYFPL